MDRKAYTAAYRKANKEKVAAYSRAYRERHPERVAARERARRERDPERLTAWREANKEKIAAYRRSYYLANREEAAESQRAWQAANREKAVMYAGRRRARKVSAPGSHTLEQRRIKFVELGNRCFYCGCGGKMVTEHQTPLCRGGSNDINNIVPACGPCNSRKGTKTLDEFLDHFRVDNRTALGYTSPCQPPHHNTDRV